MHFMLPVWHSTKKIEFYIKDFFSKCGQIRSFLRIWSYLLKKSLTENFIFCAVWTSCCKISTMIPEMANNYLVHNAVNKMVCAKIFDSWNIYFDCPIFWRKNLGKMSRDLNLYTKIILTLYINEFSNIIEYH